MNKENSVLYQQKCKLLEVVQQLLLTMRFKTEKEALAHIWNNSRQKHIPIPFKVEKFSQYYNSYRKFKHRFLKGNLSIN